MQETKRRGKKGVILLAVVVALLVMAILPAAALAAVSGSISINGGAAYTTSTGVNVNIKATSGAEQMTGYSWRVNGGAWKTPVPFGPGFSMDVNQAVTLDNTPNVSQTVEVRISDNTATWWNLPSKSIILVDTSVPISVIDSFSAPVFYGGDGPGVWVKTSLAVRAQFDIDPMTQPAMGTTLFNVNGGALQSVSWNPPTPNNSPYVLPPMQTVIPAGAQDGVYTIQHWAVNYAGVRQPNAYPTIDKIGKDTEAPEISVTPADWLTPVWHSTDASYLITVNDPGGSGVDWVKAEVRDASGAWISDVTMTPVAWDPYTFTGTAKVPANIATQSHPIIHVTTEDFADNYKHQDFYPNVDVQAPSTVVESASPDGTVTEPPVLGTWTNKAVTITFLAGDRGGNGQAKPEQGMYAGVDYSEYILGSEATGAPALTASGTKLPANMQLTVNKPAAVGPVVVWYRSVDKASPANLEKWNKIWVWFDNVAPVLSDNAPTWWVDSGSLGMITWGQFYSPGFWVELKAVDANSGVAIPGISWMIEGHNPPFGQEKVGDDVFVPIIIAALSDGIRNLDYSVTDRAGNTTSKVTPIKIDTRAPSTDGAAGWVNGLKPYVLTAVDQVPGSGIAATVYRVDQKTPWSVNAPSTVAPALATSISWTSPVQGALHTVDFASVDAALPYNYTAQPGVPSWHFGNWEMDVLSLVSQKGAYKSRTVQLDITAPTVTVSGADSNWHNAPVTLDFSASDVGAGVDYVEWSTDGGHTWTKGNSAIISENGQVDVAYHAVDKVGIASADKHVTVMISTTPPVVSGGGNVSVKSGQKASFTFSVDANTPTCRVTIQITDKATGRIYMNKNFKNVATGSDQTKGFKIPLKAGKYNIRIGATDLAGQTQVPRAVGTLTVSK
jgi:hypothetical protein